MRSIPPGSPLGRCLVAGEYRQHALGRVAGGAEGGGGGLREVRGDAIQAAGEGGEIRPGLGKDGEDVEEIGRCRRGAGGQDGAKAEGDGDGRRSTLAARLGKRDGLLPSNGQLTICQWEIDRRFRGGVTPLGRGRSARFRR
jgi:hypothetical protein